MHQSTIDFRPASHANDPVTSREAEAAVTHSGQRQRDLDVVVAAVRNAPGRTAKGYAALLEMDLYAVRRRLTDGKNLGLLAQGDPITLPGERRSEVTWRPA